MPVSFCFHSYSAHKKRSENTKPITQRNWIAKKGASIIADAPS